MSHDATITISRKGASQLRAGHLWVYSTDVLDAHAENGQIVSIADPLSRPLGYGFYSKRSKIAVRWVAGPAEPVDVTLWRQRLTNALRYRERIVSNTEAYRLVFGESDLLPSLIIDRYRGHFVLQTLTPGMELLKGVWVDLLIEKFGPCVIIERNDVRVRELEGLPQQAGVLYGTPDSHLEVTMNGLSFRTDLLGGQKTGAFLDQRENYEAARNYAWGSALDCFCYAGGFALHLARVCERVTAVDVSPTALADAQRNADLNELENIDFIEANVFDYLNDLKTKGRRFDTIVLDPPAFAKSRGALAGAIRGYKEINLRAMQLLNPGGTLITCSCSYNMSEELFLGVLSSAAVDAHRKVQILEKRMQARDHPILLSMPETYYLKCIILRMLEQNKQPIKVSAFPPPL